MSSAAAAGDAPEEFAALADYTIDDFMSEAASDVEIFATTEGHGDVRAEEIRFLARDPDPPIATPRPKETAVKCSSAIFAEPRAPGAPHFYSAPHLPFTMRKEGLLPVYSTFPPAHRQGLP
jgi:hypothetical protein